MKMTLDTFQELCKAIRKVFQNEVKRQQIRITQLFIFYGKNLVKGRQDKSVFICLVIGIMFYFN